MDEETVSLIEQWEEDDAIQAELSLHTEEEHFCKSRARYGSRWPQEKCNTCTTVCDVMYTSAAYKKCG